MNRKPSLVPVLILLFSSSCLVIAQTQKATPEFIQKEISQGKQYCLVLLKTGKNLNLDSAKLAEIQMNHLQNLSH
ncbi:MAG: hypothetical protein HYV29_04520 [Ignavibacteriales bacterium]|nr:hypothetical protein [Ignavibacteriales bacterium]